MTVFGAVKTRAFRIQFSPSAGVGVGSIGCPGLGFGGKGQAPIPMEYLESLGYG